MLSLQNTMLIQHLLLPSASMQLGASRHVQHRRGVAFLIKSEQVPTASTSHCQDGSGRRQLLALGATVAPWLFMSSKSARSFAAETKKGFLPVTDKKDGYTFLYPFGWQEVVIEGQDKVLKDVIEPLESVSVNMIPTTKQDIRDFGSPKEVAEILIKNVLVPQSQKAKLVEASEGAAQVLCPAFMVYAAFQHDVEGKVYYTFEFLAKAPNFTRHALTSVCIGNGKFYTLTTGSNERRWEKMKERLHTVVDSFQIFNV